MFRYIAILIISIQVSRAQINGCYHENFDSAEESEFSSSCFFFPYPEWEFKTYGDEDLAAPSTSASNGYITSQDSSTCIAKNVALDVISGGQIRVTYYATGPGTRLVLRLIHFLGIVADVFTVTPELNTWATATLTSSTTGSYSFYIIAYSNTGRVAVDSVTYVNSPDDYEACAYPESESGSPEEPQVPEESPEVPETPDVPESPEEPENPEVPENPEQPENPEGPETPEVPESPGEPGNSGETNKTMILSSVFTILLFRLVPILSCF